METKSSSSSFSELANVLAGDSQKLFKEGDQTRKLLFGDINEALKTGGIGSNIPIIQQAVTQMNTGTARSMEAARAGMGRLGIGDDPTSQGILSQLLMGGNQRSAEVGPELAMQFIGMGPGMSGSTAATGISGLGTAAGINRSTSGSSFSYSVNPLDYFDQLFAPAGGGQSPAQNAQAFF